MEEINPVSHVNHIPGNIASTTRYSSLPTMPCEIDRTGKADASIDRSNHTHLHPTTITPTISPPKNLSIPILSYAYSNNPAPRIPIPPTIPALKIPFLILVETAGEMLVLSFRLAGAPGSAGLRDLVGVEPGGGGGFTRLKRRDEMWSARVLVP